MGGSQGRGRGWAVRRCAWRWASSLLVWLIAATARAEAPARIAVVHDSSADQRIAGRLRAELSTLGLEVVDVALGADEQTMSIDMAAERVGAFAAVQVATGTGGVEVWILDRSTGRTLLRELVTGPKRTVDDVVALQAVELLRATLHELRFLPARGTEAKPPAKKVVPISPPTIPETPPEPRLWLELGPALTASSGGVGTTAQAFVGLRFRLGRHFGFAAWASLPITRAKLEGPEGAADVAPWLFGVDAALWVFPPEARWQLSGAAGVGLAYLAIEGHAQPPAQDRADSLAAALPFVRASFSRRLGARFGLGLDGLIGIAAPQPTILFSGREVATWGRPVFASALMGELALD